MVNKYKWVLIPVGLILLTSVALASFYVGKQSVLRNVMLPTVTPYLVVTGISPNADLSQSINQETENALFSGKVTKISRDLGLFKLTDQDIANYQRVVPDGVIYYEAGVFLRGELKGYTRILATRPNDMPGRDIQFLLATKDYKTFILNDPSNDTVNYSENYYSNPYFYLDKSKIIKTATFETDHPETIRLEKPFGLIRQDKILTEISEKGKVLSSMQKQLILYTQSLDKQKSDGADTKAKKLADARNTYLLTTTQIYAVDSTGLTYQYTLAPQKDIDIYLSKLPAFRKALAEYARQVELYNQKKIKDYVKDYPSSPNYPSFPGMDVTKQSAGLSDMYYNTYSSAFPYSCGGEQGAYIVNNIKDDDLEPILSSFAVPLYTLKDINHPLYYLEYSYKIQEEMEFKAANKGESMPTLEQYIAKHPLLFFKDAWGRWGVMGEYDYQLMAGCGKPVVYLYPEKPTSIHLSFVSSMSLNTQIPEYHQGWFVNAQLNGVLTDLQPQYTNCSQINSNILGSEYAQSSCKTNSYPYIYWSGKSVQNLYPTADGGWIVEKANLYLFMQNKLREIGLTDKEANDMISYWVPTILEKNKPYYRISFFLTRQMNNFIPMNVLPQPQSVLRVFLDYDALESKPAQDPKPQQFEHFTRSGFTMVEWGGIKK